MKKIAQFALVILLFSQVAVSVAQGNLQLAPINPDFINYQNNSITRGAMPSLLMPTKSLGHDGAKTQSLPTRYDMRDSGWVTPVKDQLIHGYCGSCWTFGCMADLEALNLKQDGISYDFSEDNLNNCHTPFDYLHCKGGNFYMSSAYLLRGSGPLLESQDPYVGPIDSTCPINPIKPAEYITDAWFIPVNDQDAIKQAIIDYGSLDASFYFTFNAIRTSDSTFFFNQKYSMSTPSSSLDTSGFGQWHIVSLIGWDDNKATAANLPGAWIVKNSIVNSYYGDTTQSAGNLYVSYYDSVAWQLLGSWPKKIPFDSSLLIHNYDEAGWVTSFGFNNNSPNYSVTKFTAQQNEWIKKLSAVVPNPYTTLSFDVYSNFNGTTFSGLLGSISAQACTFSGYNSFDLTTPIPITSGSSYYIKVKYDCPSNPTYLIPIEMAYPGYSTNTNIETGKCWVSGNGVSWTSLGANTSYKYDLCVKSYATSLNPNSIKSQDKDLFIHMYPNPVESNLEFEFPDNRYKLIFIRNIQGQLIMTKVVASQKTSINVSALPAGVYFVTMQTDQGTSTSKLIRQN